jgi:hypothetical protein
MINKSISNISKYKTDIGVKEINHLFIYNKQKPSFEGKSYNNTYKGSFSSFSFNEVGEKGEEAALLHKFIKSKESEIKYLLFKLNSLIKKIKYIINIIKINKKFLKNIDKIKSRSEVKVSTIKDTAISSTAASAATATQYTKNEINNSKVLPYEGFAFDNKKLKVEASIKAAAAAKKDLYLQISN